MDAVFHIRTQQDLNELHQECERDPEVAFGALRNQMGIDPELGYLSAAGEIFGMWQEQARELVKAKARIEELEAENAELEEEYAKLEHDKEVVDNALWEVNEILVQLRDLLG